MDCEFHEISVPFGLTGACRVDRKTGTQEQVVQRYAIYTGSTFHPPNLSEFCSNTIKLKLTHPAKRTRQKLFVLDTQHQPGGNKREVTDYLNRGTASHVDLLSAPMNGPHDRFPTPWHFFSPILLDEYKGPRRKIKFGGFGLGQTSGWRPSEAGGFMLKETAQMDLT